MEVQFVGPNGAGKTTILEAIYLLARGRTFRGKKAGPLTSDGEAATLVEGWLDDPDEPRSGESHLTFSLRDQVSERRLNGILIGRQAPGVGPLRAKLVGENPQILFEGGPAIRRGLLDWNLFHVEHRVGSLRGELRRVLAQRNAALRERRSMASAWDPTFIALSRELTAKRLAFIELWRSEFLDLARAHPFLEGFTLEFHPGWPGDRELADVLHASRPRDQARGQTLFGPHRADLRIIRERTPARFSRGQAKVSVLLLQIAAERVHRERGIGASVWLVDDLDAELDAATKTKVRTQLCAQHGQRFSTALSDAWSLPEPGNAQPPTRFHVEHQHPHSIPQRHPPGPTPDRASETSRLPPAEGTPDPLPV